MDPQKALPYVTTRFEPLCVKFHAHVTSVGESGEKIKIFHVFRQALPCGRLAQILGYVFVNCAEFYRNTNRLRGLVSVRGRNLTIPIGLRCRR